MRRDLTILGLRCKTAKPWGTTLENITRHLCSRCMKNTAVTSILPIPLQRFRNKPNLIKELEAFKRRKWWPEVESNHRHEDFQSSALPTELSGHTACLTLAASGVLNRCRGFPSTVVSRCIAFYFIYGLIFEESPHLIEQILACFRVN